MAVMPDPVCTGCTLYCRAFLKCHVQCGQVLQLCQRSYRFMEDMQYRVKKRIVGNIAGVLCFTALYFLLPSSIYAYIGILGGIGVGFSAKYGWQAVFNTFGALAIAAESYGLKGAVSLRVIQNVFGVVFALVFCAVFYLGMSKKMAGEN